ncbi:10562_t:CDS:2, partial [Racocetra persica]
DEDILLQIKSYVQENKWNITLYMIMSQMNKILLPGLKFALPLTISLNTAKNYLKELEYVYERRINELEYRMSIFSGDNMEKSEDLINQIINRAISIFEACFLEYQALFAFDNATSHAIFSPNALIANYMNLGLAGKQEKLRSTSYF